MSLNTVTAPGPPTIHHSSLAIPLEEIGGTWLNDFDLGFNLPAEFTTPTKDGTLANVKVEPHSVDIPNSLSGEFDDFDMTDRPGTSSSSSSCVNQAPTTTVASPNLASLSISSLQGHCQLPPNSIYYSSSPPFSSTINKPQLTPGLIALLPSLNTYASSRQLSQQPTLLSYLIYAEESTSYTYPFLNWKTLRERALELLVNARPTASSPAANARDKEMALEKEFEFERDKKERDAAQARQLFMGSASSRRPVFGNSSTGDVTMEDLSSQVSRSLHRPEVLEDHRGRPSTFTRIVEDIPFFAVLCAAIALGAHEAEIRSSNIPRRDDIKKGAGRPWSKTNSSPESIYWYLLSVQAISIWDAYVAVTPAFNETPSTPIDSRDSNNDSKKENRQHEMDYISACLLQLTFLSKEGLNASVTVVGTDKVSPKNQDNLQRKSPGLSKDSSKLQSPKGVAAVMFPLVSFGFLKL
ncbi:hypothetical protein DFH05DRAFT_943894 [Lentinula detonsa]|uniref:Uncharacterized protein n=1 Tax=Lentinula detonsa TaxID=2804962 RepID=A0A9W8TZ77_9AGAR|nr:hypothetical protein DFH05DRAFT_943894 [Lentinula detonsa]